MIEYLSVEEVIAMHDAFLQEFGGLPGIRDINLLMSAVETPKGQMFGQICIQPFTIKQQPTFTILFAIIHSMMGTSVQVLDLRCYS